MKKSSSQWLQSFFNPTESKVAAGENAPATNLESLSPHALGRDQAGNPIENPLRSHSWHTLVLGASGSGKTTLITELIRDLPCRLIWLTTESSVLTALESAVSMEERFEFPVLLVVDDAHRFAENLDLIELIARDGIRSNVTLLISAQLLSDLPQAIWKNCQIRFVLGLDSFSELPQETVALNPFEVGFAWPGSTGIVKISKPAKNWISRKQEEGNPLLRRAATPQLAPYEEFAQAHRTPLDLWSAEEQAEPPGLHDRQLGSTALPRRTRYSRTL